MATGLNSQVKRGSRLQYLPAIDEQLHQRQITSAAGNHQRSLVETVYQVGTVRWRLRRLLGIDSERRAQAVHVPNAQPITKMHSRTLWRLHVPRGVVLDRMSRLTVSAESRQIGHVNFLLYVNGGRAPVGKSGTLVLHTNGHHDLRLAALRSATLPSILLLRLTFIRSHEVQLADKLAAGKELAIVNGAVSEVGQHSATEVCVVGQLGVKTPQSFDEILSQQRSALVDVETSERVDELIVVHTEEVVHPDCPRLEVLVRLAEEPLSTPGLPRGVTVTAASCQVASSRSVSVSLFRIAT